MFEQNRPPRAFSRIVLTALLVPVLAVGSYATAHAFASSTSPLTVSGYGSWGKSYGSWTVTRGSGTAVRSYLPTAFYRYDDSDNHTVYVKLTTEVGKAGSGYFDRVAEVHLGHENTVSSRWTSFRKKPTANLDALKNRGIIATGGVVTCLDIPFRADPCGTLGLRSVIL